MPVDFSNPANRKRKPRYNANARYTVPRVREKAITAREQQRQDMDYYNRWYRERQSPYTWAVRTNTPYYEGANEAQRAAARRATYTNPYDERGEAIREAKPRLKARYSYSKNVAYDERKEAVKEARKWGGSRYTDTMSEALKAYWKTYKRQPVLPPPTQPSYQNAGYNSGYGGHGYGGGGYGGGGGGYGYGSYPEYTGSATRQPTYTRASYAPNIPRWMTALVNWRLGE